MEIFYLCKNVFILEKKKKVFYKYARLSLLEAMNAGKVNLDLGLYSEW